MKNRNIGQYAAIEAMKNGKYATRKAWEGMGVYLGVKLKNSGNSIDDMCMPVGCLLLTHGASRSYEKTVWFMTEEDIAATDYIILDEIPGQEKSMKKEESPYLKGPQKIMNALLNGQVLIDKEQVTLVYGESKPSTDLRMDNSFKTFWKASGLVSAFTDWFHTEFRVLEKAAIILGPGEVHIDPKATLQEVHKPAPPLCFDDWFTSLCEVTEHKAEFRKCWQYAKDLKGAQ